MFIEKKVLSQSVGFAIVFALVGIIVGIITRSYVIAFDGIYSIMSVLLSLFALFSFKFMSTHDWKRYPFGKYAVEPLVVLVQSSILLLTLVISVVFALIALLNGGREVNASFALGYAIVSAFSCLIITLYFRHKSKQFKSGILKSETTHWMFDTLVSFGVLVTFVLVELMRVFNIMTSLIPLIDPVVVIIMGLVFAKLPITQMIDSVQELIGVSSEDELSSNIKNLIQSLEKQYLFKESFLRVSQGRQHIWIEVDFVVDETSLIQSIKDQDKVRESIDRSLKHIKMDKWVTVSFTTDRKWAM